MYKLYLIDFMKTPECISADTYETLKDAVDEYSRCGWEEMEGVVSQSVIIKNDKEEIEAVGVYVNSDDVSVLPILLWIFSDGTMEQRYYETEYLRFIDSNFEQEVYND